jgi:membrane-associated phospholipid phosphatase
MTEKIKKRIKIIFLVMFFVLSVGFEFLYRDLLFDKTLVWVEKMQIEWTHMEKFFEFVTSFGTLPAFLPMFIIIYLWCPNITSYTFILNFTYSSFIVNVLKIIYSNPRPYWVKPSILLSCSPGFGNPSGHSLDSTSVYLSIWHLITDHSFFIKYWPFKYILLLIIMAWVIFIVLSRVYLAAHSFNQILYGMTLGFCIYFLIFCVLEIHKTEPKTFFTFFRNKKNNLLITLKFALFMLVFLLIYVYRTIDTENFEIKLKEICPDLMEANRFNNDGLTKGLIYSIIIGTQYGIILLSNIIFKYYPDKEDEVNKWNSTSFVKNIYKILICLILATPLLAYIAIDVSSSVIVFSLCKVSIPLLVTLFNVYGFAIILIIRLKIANMKIYEERAPVMKDSNFNNNYTNVHNRFKDNSNIT